MKNPTLHREYLNSVKPFMRFQVGEIRKRPLRIVINGKESHGFYFTQDLHEVFHLLGFGETLEAAERMAGL